MADAVKSINIVFVEAGAVNESEERGDIGLDNLQTVIELLRGISYLGAHTRKVTKLTHLCRH